MNDFTAMPQALRQQEKAAACRVLDSGHYILGNEVRAFETQWAAACGTRHAVGVGNGMDAIEIGLRALRIGPGDEVITTAMTAFATVLAIIRCGATPVLADIEPDTGLLCPESAARCLTPRTRAVLLVHLYGQVRNMQHWQAWAAAENIFLIEDCAQSHLARSGEKAAGTFGAYGAFSFYPTKNLGAAGDAGALVTSDDDIAVLAARLRNYGQAQQYLHTELGNNSRLDEMQAALLQVRLAWLDEFTATRRAIAAVYRRLLNHPAVQMLAAPEQESSHVHHLFVVRTDQREALATHLRAQQVESAVHYPRPIHQQPACNGIRHDPAGLPHAEQHARTCLSLPCHPCMTTADAEHVAKAVNAFG